MKFNLTDEIPFERELVFSTHRDKLVELVPYLPNVDSVVIQSREEDGDVVRLVNEWTGASSDVPAVVRPVLKPEHLSWVDRATWDVAKWRCDWQITISALPEVVTAKGSNTFVDEGGETLIQMTGEFVIHPDKVPGVPSFVARRAAGPLEKFVVGLLQPNLRRSNQAVLQYLEDNA
ncbi:MAG: hypothetical protein KTR31_00310 [Myxococcales bacterium]|nr:hypothetical protein [Myxococcales bacterium]